MGFVYADAFWLGRPRVFDSVSFVLGWMPEDSIINRREVEVLSDASDPCWYSLYTFV